MVKCFCLAVSRVEDTNNGTVHEQKTAQEEREALDSKGEKDLRPVEELHHVEAYRSQYEEEILGLRSSLHFAEKLFEWHTLGTPIALPVFF